MPPRTYPSSFQVLRRSGGEGRRAEISPSCCTAALQASLSVAPSVAGYEEYFEPLAHHLLAVKLRHWEKALRELAATALAGEAGAGEQE